MPDHVDRRVGFTVGGHVSLRSSVAGQFPVRSHRRPPVRPRVTASARQKAELLDVLRTLSCGAAALSDPQKQAQVAGLVSALEAANPTPRPVGDSLLPGLYRLEYTTSSSILGTKRPSPFRPDHNAIYQIIADDASRVTNVEMISPFHSLGWSGPTYWNRVYADASPGEGAKRVQVQFIKFQLFNGLVSFDVSKNQRFANWLDTTYLDETMRISRGGEGNLFVLSRIEDEEIKALEC